jgi:uncharacterized circularly permuted ATP-grasp superfamily protein
MYTWDETRLYVPPELTARLIELDGAGAVAFVGSPATALYDNKANLELITGPEFAHHLDDAERAMVAAHVPPTFRLLETTLERALDGRERLICKPASAYGGKDIEFGHTMSDADWRALLEARLADPRQRHVCQELVRPAVVDFAGLEPPGREVVLGSLIFGGRSAGLFLRQVVPHGAAPINVKQGAEAAAILTVSP